MAKFYGKVGYATTVESSPGIWTNQIVEKTYFGDLIRSRKTFQTVDKVNDDVNVSNEISIVADPFAYENFQNMVYVEYLGSKWKVNSVDFSRPRLIISIGGVYSD